MRPTPEEWLDRRYRMESRNLLQPEPYRGPMPTPARAVLLELLTGVDCEPCVSVELAADALLHRYARQNLVLLARHAVRDTPSVILDGEIIQPGEGLASVSKPVFDAIDAAVQKHIAAPAEAGLQLKSTWKRSASLSVDALVDHAAGAKLQLYLVETELSKSGTNGIRLHPMVARASAQDGFDIDGSTFHAHWTFDTAPVLGKLAVVAVVQDAGAERVLQSAYLPARLP